MLLSSVSVLVIALQSSEIPEGLMNNPVFIFVTNKINMIGIYQYGPLKFGPLFSWLCLAAYYKAELKSSVDTACEVYKSLMVT
jgi:hypothetical protein